MAADLPDASVPRDRRLTRRSPPWQRRLWPEPGDWRDQHPWAVTIVERLEADAAGDGTEPGQAWFDQHADERGWEPSTRALYARALACAGYPVAGPSSPGPWAGPRSLPLLWTLGPAATPTQLRVAAWARVAAGWPGEVADWHALDDADIELEGDDAFVHGRRVLGAAPAWRAWRAWCDTHLAEPVPAARAALVRVRPADALSPAGERLSVRGMQDAFARGARRAASMADEMAQLAAARGDHDRAGRLRADAGVYAQLTYDSFRRLMLQAGASPVRPDARGAVRY